MDNEKTFKTKTGFCHVLPDKIVLTRDGITGNITTVTVGDNISRILIIYGGLSIGLFYFAFDNYRNGQIVQSILFGLLGAYLVYGILNSISNSATPIIDRQKIKEVKLKKAIVGLTRSRFEVLFENDQGKIKKRLIMLPGSLTNGQGETEKAIKIMTEEKLITNRKSSDNQF
ncbi:phosphoribosylaminoimidazolesuccinocarboxamide synthase [Sphingobacterium olei]|uniref:Phosphoribosylaminoimidazolesuccinocarboxamide synthase n=1 Tax=Sphingobacterium olei TaxID=2571155 RepID=A0A4V5MKG2_9SPHI|nr:phosphoribosylaminoimidazolesuccinocarboxamide synthase [Sphingobacterium olei]TJZ51818.1 phosphoribosylaminoimidazolesuccinocarboxamide synthase [Sphingobacterium olei]